MEQKVIKIIEEHTDSRDIKATDRLREDLGADSLDVVEIIMEIEEEFDIEIEDEVFEEMKTVQGIIDYVKGEMSE